MSLNRILYLLLLISLSSGCSKMIVEDIDMGNLPVSDNLQSEVDHFAKPLIENDENIGVVVETLKADNTSNFYTYGHLSNRKVQKMQRDTVFALGSATKPMVSSLLLILEEKGFISLDETLGETLPASIKYKDQKVKNITLKELVTHVSGLPREPLVLDGLKLAAKYSFTGNNIYGYLDAPTMFEFLADYEIGEKSKKAQYSNIGMGLVAYAMTLRMNQPLEELLTQYLFKPLGMNDTAIKLSERQQERLAVGHVGDFPLFMVKNKPLENWVFSPIMEGTGGIYSTAPDIMKFIKAHLGKSGTPLDKVFERSKEMFSYDGKLFYTLGWEVDRVEKYDVDIYFKYGVIAGYNCYMGMELETENAIVVLRNNFNWKDKIGHNMLLRLVLSDRKLMNGRNKY